MMNDYDIKTQKELYMEAMKSNVSIDDTMNAYQRNYDKFRNMPEADILSGDFHMKANKYAIDNTMNELGIGKKPVQEKKKRTLKTILLSI
mgnify:CR=1 FL=1